MITWIKITCRGVNVQKCGMSFQQHSSTTTTTMKAQRLLLPLRQKLQPFINTTTKRYATTAAQISAAAPINFHNPEYEARISQARDGRHIYARMVPASPAYFSAQPNFIDGWLRLQALQGQYSGLPRVPAGEAPRVAWRTLQEYKNMVGEDIQRTRYYRMIEILADLNRIEGSLMPEVVKSALEYYKRDVNPFQNVKKPVYVDSLGRALGLGRRKASSARAWVVEGTGEVLINGKKLSDYFGRIHDRESAIWPLKATDRIGKYNVWALVEGGGTTGQAEALTLAVAKALMVHEPSLKPALRRGEYNCITAISKTRITYFWTFN